MIHLLEAGVRSTLQDGGRRGHLRSGVPEAGPVDRFAFRAAQALAGNDDAACAIEIVGLPFTFRCDDTRLVAAAGPDVWLSGPRRMPGWTAVLARAGEELTVRGSGRTRFAYLAVSGGVAVELVLGSRSTYLPAHLGPVPRPLAPGDAFPLGVASASGVPGRRIASPTYAEPVAFVAGPHRERFPAASREALAGGPFVVLPESDRMGTRLMGPSLEPFAGELLTCGVVAGAIQVPRGGAPIVLLADHQTTGGYPVIATVIGAHLGLVAQAAPGDPLRLYEVDRERAVAELRAERTALVPAA